MNKIIKRPIKKLFKTGFFSGFEVGNDTLTFKHGGRVFSLQRVPGVYGYLMSSGYVFSTNVMKPSFKSDYTRLEMQTISQFVPDFRQGTTNPDYVLRAAKSLIGVNKIDFD